MSLHVAKLRLRKRGAPGASQGNAPHLLTLHQMQLGIVNVFSSGGESDDEALSLLRAHIGFLESHRREPVGLSGTEALWLNAHDVFVSGSWRVDYFVEPYGSVEDVDGNLGTLGSSEKSAERADIQADDVISDLINLDGSVKSGGVKDMDESLEEIGASVESGKQQASDVVNDLINNMIEKATSLSKRKDKMFPFWFKGEARPAAALELEAFSNWRTMKQDCGNISYALHFLEASREASISIATEILQKLGETGGIDWTRQSYFVNEGNALLKSELHIIPLYVPSPRHWMILCIEGFRSTCAALQKLVEGGKKHMGKDPKGIGIVMILDSVPVVIPESALLGTERYIWGWLHKWYYETYADQIDPDSALLISDVVRILMARLVHLHGPTQGNDISCGAYAIASAAYLLKDDNLKNLKQRITANRNVKSNGQRTYRNLKRSRTMSSTSLFIQKAEDLYTESFVEDVLLTQKKKLKTFLERIDQ